MANTIDQAFVKQYEAEVKEAYQRQGTRLRGSVRNKNGVTGTSTIFNKVGTMTATTKGRNQQVTPSDPAHTTVECTLADFYSGAWVDKLDELKTMIDERAVIASNGAKALGRKSDDQIVAAMATASSGRLIADGGVGLTKAKVLSAIELLNAGDVPDDGERFGLVSARGWTDLLNINEFSNTQYVGPDALPFAGASMESKRWLGVTWMRYTGLPVATNIRTNFLYHKSAIGHAVGAEITTDITWHGDYAAHFVNSMMSQGAALIDELGVVKLAASEA